MPHKTPSPEPDVPLAAAGRGGKRPGAGRPLGARRARNLPANARPQGKPRRSKGAGVPTSPDPDPDAMVDADPLLLPVGRLPFEESHISGADIVDGRHVIDPMVTCPFCKARVWKEERVVGSDSTVAKPWYNICCKQGQIQLPEIRPEPRILNMFADVGIIYLVFRNDIRKYNSVLSFTSMGVKTDKTVAGSAGIYTYRIEGIVTHNIGSLFPVGQDKGKFAQIYFYDSHEQATRRIGVFETLEKQNLLQLQDILNETNPYCQVYRSIKDREGRTEGMTAEEVEQLKVVLKGARDVKAPHVLQYDKPTAGEIAVLLPTDVSEVPDKRDILIQGKNNELERIWETHPAFDSLQYVLLQPYGEDGWMYDTYLKADLPTYPASAESSTASVEFVIPNELDSTPATVPPHVLPPVQLSQPSQPLRSLHRMQMEVVPEDFDSDAEVELDLFVAERLQHRAEKQWRRTPTPERCMPEFPPDSFRCANTNIAQALQCFRCFFDDVINLLFPECKSWDPTSDVAQQHMARGRPPFPELDLDRLQQQNAANQYRNRVKATHNKNKIVSGPSGTRGTSGETWSIKDIDIDGPDEGIYIHNMPVQDYQNFVQWMELYDDDHPDLHHDEGDDVVDEPPEPESDPLDENYQGDIDQYEPLAVFADPPPVIGSKKKRVYVSCNEFYAYHMMIRSISKEDSCPYFWCFGRLSQQFVVDMFAKIESQWLGWMHKNQKTLQADQYCGVVDAVAHDLPGTQTGKFIVLPSSYTGGPRYMNACYHDSMTIVKHFGKPDLFITFTCNTNWPEITRKLVGPWQLPQNHPDLSVQLFYIKLKALLKDVMVNGILGAVAAFMWVIEFQKHGLPHAHILAILQRGDKPKTATDIDSIVSAEIPDPVKHPLAYETVTKTMIHGPCGDHWNKNAQCLVTNEKNKKDYCSKHYPCPLVPETTVDDNGYPQYRCSSPGNEFWKTGIRSKRLISNAWIVPHNLWLSTKFNAHINVEVCSTFQVVKYLFKYVYKGGDKAQISVNQQGDVHVEGEVRTSPEQGTTLEHLKKGDHDEVSLFF